MSKQDNLTDFLTDVADAIREKKGTTDKINPQNFSEEIKSIETSSPFAVDFGEEIATGNPAFIGTLQEDIDYYNQIQEERRLYAEGKGGRSDAAIKNDAEFQKKITWWPSGMTYVDIDLAKLRRIKQWPGKGKDVIVRSSFYNAMNVGFVPLDMDWDFSNTTLIGYFLTKGVVGNVDLYLPNISEIRGEMLKSIFTGPHVKVSLPNYTGKAQQILGNSVGTEVFEFYAPKAVDVSTTGRTDFNTLKEIYADISSATIGGQAFYNNSSLRVAHIKGLMFSIYILQSSLQLESVKYILDNCQARADGAAYTLTLHATVKQNFMNKCTEGHADYDAEYAASLASANSKGLTLA